MKKHTTKNKKSISKIVIISVAVFVLCCIAVSAAYINQNIVKRVVSTQGTVGTPFSSNYLMLVPRGDTTYAVKSIYCSEGAENVELEINVCNYVQNDPSKISEKDIEYTLTITQLNKSGTINTDSFSGLKVTDKNGTSFSFANGVCSIENQTLAGNVKTVNTYKIVVPKSMTESVMLRAVAEPSNDNSYSVANGNKLGRVFAFSEYTVTSTTWTGSFSETTVENYDAFNYVLRGQGKGTVKISWDFSQLEISKVFLDTNNLHGNITTEGGKKVLTMEVDSTVGQNRYDIQFYKTSSGVYTDMETVGGYVTVDFTEAIS